MFLGEVLLDLMTNEVSLSVSSEAVDTTDIFISSAVFKFSLNCTCVFSSCGGLISNEKSIGSIAGMFCVV